jgi:predicted glycoside hydrolase/deacetylase ChbG (UPF0249 family)
MTRARSLIVNADDFGLSEGVTDGIIQTMQRGIVTSTSLLANGPKPRCAGSERSVAGRSAFT